MTIPPDMIERCALAMREKGIDIALPSEVTLDDLEQERYDALVAGLTAALGETHVVVPKAALEWLYGEGPDADGKWFGENVTMAQERIAGDAPLLVEKERT
jgi:hypothetical protein